MAYEIPIDSTAIDLLIQRLDEATQGTRNLREESSRLNDVVRHRPRMGRAGVGGGGILGGGGGAMNDPWTAYEIAKANYPQPTLEADRAARYNEAVALKRMQTAEGVLSPAAPPLKYIGGVHQRAFEAEQWLQNARESKDPRKIRDAELYAERARAARDKAEAPPKSRQDLLWEAFSTSRIGPGGKLMPLISRLRAAGTTQEELQNHFVGMGADPAMAAKIAPMAARIAAGALPIALAATGVAAAVAGVVMVTNRALEMGRAGSAGYWGGGGSPRATGQGMALAGFLGKDLTASATGFGEQLRGGSFGAGYFRSRGVYDMGPYTTDKTANYIRGIDELRRIKSDQIAIRVARDTGMVDELRYRDMTDSTYGRLKRSMGARGSAQSRQDSAEFDANRTIIQNWFDAQVAAAGNRVVQVTNAATSPFGGLERVGEFLQKLVYNSPVGMGFIDRVTGLVNGGNGDQNRSGGGSDTTKALKDLTRQLKDTTEQIGGGGRDSGIPAGFSSSWKLNNTDESLKAQAAMLGAFSVG